jgi:hypothetical protein
MGLDVVALARDAGARVKIGLARYELEPNAENEERLSRAVADWERALDAWTAAVYLGTVAAGDSLGVVATIPLISIPPTLAQCVVSSGPGGAVSSSTTFIRDLAERPQGVGADAAAQDDLADRCTGDD